MRTFFLMFVVAAPLLSLEPLALAKKPKPVVVVAPPPVVVAPPPAVVAPPVVVAPPLVRPQHQVVHVAPPPPPPQPVYVQPVPPVHTVQVQTVPIQVAPPVVTVQAVPMMPGVEVVEGGYAPGYAAAPPPPPPSFGPPCLMHQGGMSALVGAIQGESFSSGQLRVLADAAQGHCFRVTQVAEVLPLFSFEDDKLKALEMMASGLVDRQNAFRIYSLFTFESSKDRARRILSR